MHSSLNNQPSIPVCLHGLSLHTYICSYHNLAFSITYSAIYRYISLCLPSYCPPTYNTTCCSRCLSVFEHVHICHFAYFCRMSFFVQDRIAPAKLPQKTAHSSVKYVSLWSPLLHCSKHTPPANRTITLHTTSIQANPSSVSLPSLSVSLCVGELQLHTNSCRSSSTTLYTV